MKNKFQIAMTLAMILAMVFTSLALADDVVVDGDVVAPGNQSPVNLGNVAPGQVIGTSASFTLVCSTKNHVDQGQTLNLSFSLSGSTVPAGGSLSATGATIGPIPASWPDDTSGGGSDNCGSPTPTPRDDNGNSSVTITAPMTAGPKTVVVRYTFGSGSLSPAGAGDSNAVQGNHVDVTYTFTVVAPPTDSTPPVISYVVTPSSPDGSNGWYKSNVTLVWSVTDPESSVTKTGCVDQNITTDQAATTYSCSASSAGGTAAQVNVTIKRDATAPTASASALPAPNANGWNNTDVTVSFSGNDGTGSGIDFCSSPVVLSSDGAGQSASGTCTDKAGNVSAPATASGINIDKTKPVINGSASPAANGLGWNNTDVAVSFSCTDALSGVDTNTVAGATLTSEGAGQSVTNTGTCTDKAGNAANSATVSGINIDKTAPTIAFVSPSTSIWHNADVTANWTCSDALSGAVSATATATTSGEGTAQPATGTCADNAGNTASDTQSFMVDQTDPLITFVSPSTSVWYNADVTANWTCSDALSGAVSATATATTSGEGTAQPATGTCADNAGNTASDTQSFMVDQTDPIITFVGPSTSIWYNTDVTANWTCSDALSGEVSATVTATTSGEGTAQPATGTCADNAGNTASDTQSFMVDKTAPSVSLVGGPANGATYYFGFVPAAPTCTASDALSGLDGTCSVSGYSNAIGTHTVSASAKDLAGNSGSSASITYTVLGWTINGFFQPVDMNKLNIAKNGSTVPLKFEVFAGPTELTNVAFIKDTFVQKLTCGTGIATDDIENYATGGTSLRYDTTGGQFIFNWQTPKIANNCYHVTLTLQDGSKIEADFRLK